MEFTDIIPKLSIETLNAIHAFGFSRMTPVQSSAIPLFLSNKDVCVEATTGSGKTLAFGIPIFEILTRRAIPLRKNEVGALVIAPTRELASQIFDVFQKLTEFHKSLRCMLLVGGTSVQSTIDEFKLYGTQIIIGTPGRTVDIMNRCNGFNFKELEVLVLDEADTLLDMGFRETINQILSMLPKQRRTGLFSATQTRELKELARAGMRNPVTICVRVQGKKNETNNNDNENSNLKSITNSDNQSTSTNINNLRKQMIPSTLISQYMICPYESRMKQLLSFLLRHQSDKIIIFVSTCACVDYYSTVIQSLFTSKGYLQTDWSILGLHGKMVPKKRNGLYKRFVSLSAGALFCTDVAARGVDIPDVDWIIQLTAPKDPSFFIHRVGRTARAGRQGGALLFVTEAELSYIELLRNRGVPMEEIEQFLVSYNCNSNVVNDNESSITKSKTTKVDTSGLHDGDDDDDDDDYDNGDSDEQMIRSEESDDKLSEGNIFQEMRRLATLDRSVLEAGSTAFMSFLRAYKEHQCSYIFRFNELNIGEVAKAYALLRLPKIPETRGKTPIEFEEMRNVDITTIPYLNKAREGARLRRLEALREENQKEKEKAAVDPVKPAKRTLPTEIGEEPKRKRAKKQGRHAKIMEEWDELAAEEYLYKQFKKGKLNKTGYEEALYSEDVVEQATLKRQENSQRGEGVDDDDDDDSEALADSDGDGDSGSAMGRTVSSKKATGKSQDESSESDKESEDEIGDVKKKGMGSNSSGRPNNHTKRLPESSSTSSGRKRGSSRGGRHSAGERGGRGGVPSSSSIKKDYRKKPRYRSK